MASSQLPRRAVFYVPASSPRMVQKSLTCQTDNVTYDLEDSVVNDKKPDAREALVRHIGALPLAGEEGPARPREIAVRVNPISTAHGGHDVLAVARLPSLDAILLPKVDDARTVRAMAEMMASVDRERRAAWEERRRPGQQQQAYYRPLALMALIESARAVENLGEICRAGTGNDTSSHDQQQQQQQQQQRPGTLSGIVFGAEDFARDLSAERTPSLGEFLYARSRMVTSARAHGVPSVIDLVCTQLDRHSPSSSSSSSSSSNTGSTSNTKKTRLEEECEGGRSMGFNGKQVIHPAQLETVHRVFGVPREAAVWAVRVVVANAKAEQAGLGAWVLDGDVVDVPVIRRARALVERARQVGYDVDGMMEAHKDVQPDAK